MGWGSSGHKFLRKFSFEPAESFDLSRAIPENNSLKRYESNPLVQSGTWDLVGGRGAGLGDQGLDYGVCK